MVSQPAAGKPPKQVEFVVPQQLLRNANDSSALYDIHLLVKYAESAGAAENMRSENRRALTLIYYEGSEADHSEASRSVGEALRDVE